MDTSLGVVRVLLKSGLVIGLKFGCCQSVVAEWSSHWTQVWVLSEWSSALDSSFGVVRVLLQSGLVH